MFICADIQDVYMFFISIRGHNFKPSITYENVIYFEKKNSAVFKISLFFVTKCLAYGD